MLPTLLPDMTLYSLTACAHRISGLSRGPQTSLAWYGDAHAGLSHDFPSNLGQFCARTGYIYGTPDTIARVATTLPYFVRFRSPDVEARVLEAMCGAVASRLKFQLGLPAGPTGSSFPLRACPRCMAEDEDEFGLVYWHRRHQLPGVYYCERHGHPLRQSRLRIDRRRRSIFLLPNDEEIFQEERFWATSPGSAAILLRLATLSADVLDQPFPSGYSPECLRATYLHGLRNHGLLTRTGLVRVSEFLKWIRDAYLSVAHFSPYDWLLSELHLQSLLRPLRKPRSEFNATYHVLLIDALFGNWERFVQAYQWETVMTAGMQEPAWGAEQEVAPTPELSALAQRARDENRSLSSLCREAGIDFQTATRQLIPAGAVHVVRRPKVLTADLRGSVINALRAGEAQADVAARVSLSRATVDRICVETPGLHHVWTEARLERKRTQARQQLNVFLSQFPGATRGDARRDCSAAYGWLLRHDAKWLAIRIPRAATGGNTGKRVARINWEKRDHQCLDALRSLAARGNIFVAKERHTPGVILRKLPVLGFSLRLERLPKSKAFVAELLSRDQSRLP